MPVAQNVLAKITSALGLQNTRFAVDRTVDVNKSIYKAVIPKFLYKPPFGYPRFIDIPEQRRLAATPFVEMCISTIIDEIMAVEWNIVPKEDNEPGESTGSSEEHCKSVKEFFDNPNINKESFGSQLKKIIRDILTIDSGVWVKVFDIAGQMRELYVRDGGTFTINVDIFGTFQNKVDIITADFAGTWNNPDFWTSTGQPRQQAMMTLNQVAEQAAYFQYGWITGARPMPFGRREIVYIQRNPRPDSIYGRSPVEICLDTVQMLVYGIDHNLEYYTDNNIPKGVFQLIGANEPDIRLFSEKWREATRIKNEVGDYRKRFYHMPVINQEGKFERIGFSNAELELISQSQWFSKVLWACFGVTPSELGFTESSNRATEVIQSRVFRRKAIRPILKLLEYHINTEIIPEFENGVVINAGMKDEDVVSGIDDVKFQFDMYDINEDLQKHELYQLQIRNKLRTPNEIREEQGLEPVEGGDKLGGTQPSPFGGFGRFGRFGEEQEETEKETEKKAIETKPFGKYADFDACVRANKGKKNPKAYCASLHKKITGKWPRQKAFNITSPLIMGEFEVPAIDKILKKLFKFQEKQIKERLKLFAAEDKLKEIKALDQDTIQELKNIINLETVEEPVRKAIEEAYLKSLDSIEVDFDMNFIPNRNTMNFIERRALDYVRDLGEEIKSKLRKELETGLIQGESIPKLKSRITKIFDVAETRANTIARTEIALAENAGKLEGYMQSGMKGKVEWVAKLDGRTSEICRHLNGEEQPIGNKFNYKDWEGFSPPAHPNCRSRLVFRPD